MLPDSILAHQRGDRDITAHFDRENALFDQVYAVGNVGGKEIGNNAETTGT